MQSSLNGHPRDATCYSLPNHDFSVYMLRKEEGTKKGGGGGALKSILFSSYGTFRWMEKLWEQNCLHRSPPHEHHSVWSNLLSSIRGTYWLNFWRRRRKTLKRFHLFLLLKIWKKHSASSHDPKSPCETVTVGETTVNRSRNQTSGKQFRSYPRTRIRRVEQLSRYREYNSKF